MMKITAQPFAKNSQPLSALKAKNCVQEEKDQMAAHCQATACQNMVTAQPIAALFAMKAKYYAIWDMDQKAA